MENIEYLNSLEFMILGLERIKKALELLDNPQDNLRIIHVAGTNGKGSVCAMISSILGKVGYKVGLYTSPHLVRVNERIRIGDREISDEELDEYIGKIRKAIKDIKLTYFEFLSVLSFYYFYEKNVDYAVIEVGLGGRLDATNVVKPIISVITNIEMEHEDILGRSIEKIAKEKAGIIKDGTKVVTGTFGKALDVISSVCKEKNCKLITVKEESNNEIGLLGKFQKKNAAIAVKIAKELDVDNEAIKKGLKEVKWPARLEFFKENILLDCAHNPSGMKVLVEFLSEEKRDITLIIGISNDKNYKKMLKQIIPLCKRVIITKANIMKALDVEKIEEEVKNYDVEYHVEKKIKDAVSKGLEVNDGLLLVTGSIYVVGEVLEELRKD